MRARDDNNRVKMAEFTIQQKVQCCYWLAEFKFPIAVQRRFRQEYAANAPDRHTIMKWYNQLLETGSLLRKKGSGKKPVPAARVEDVRQAFQRSPRKSIRRASLELGMPKTTVHTIVHKRLRLRAYKIQLVQKLQRNDRPKRVEFANALLARIDDDNDFLNHVAFSDEATFHTCGKVHRHNCRIWGEENPHVVMEYERDSPKVNVWCALTCDTVIGPFFFAEKTVTGTTYLDMLENYAIPQLPNEFFFQQDGAPPHYANEVRNYLNNQFPNKWIGRSGPIEWPPRSPDLTPLDFFLWGYVKSRIYQTPVQDLADLRGRIIDACASVTPAMLQNTWREIEYRLDVIRATRGAHMEIY